MAVKKTKALKKLAGTYQKAKEKKPRIAADIHQEIVEVKEAIDAMRVALRLATQELGKKGLMVLTTVTDSNGAFMKVHKLNPAAKAQKDSLKMQQSLRKQLAGLEAELDSSTVKTDEDDELADFD
jgi:hypothetical protein